MGQFFHQNVVQLHGVISIGEPVSITVIDSDSTIIAVGISIPIKSFMYWLQWDLSNQNTFWSPFNSCDYTELNLYNQLGHFLESHE